MAGTPQRRAKREAAAALEAGDTIPEATPRVDARDAPTHARTRTRERAAPPPLQKPVPGPRLKAVGDAAQADIAEDIAEQLQAGLAVRIDRTKPGWCAGWQEDYILESGDMGELLDHIKDQYGGKTYRLTALAPGGAPLWVSKLNVGGRPREEGRLLVRWKYEGEPDPDAPVAAPPVQAAAGGGIEAMLPFMTMMMDASKEASTAQLNAVRASMATASESQAKLMALLVEERSAERQSASLGGQLQNLAESAKALKKAGTLFGAVADTGGGGGGDESMMDGAMREAMSHFMSNVVQSEFGDKAPAQPAATRAQRPTQNGIPEAIPRGQSRT